MKPIEVEKEASEYRCAEFELFGTSEPEIVWVEWESEQLFRLALRLHELVQKHALRDSFLQPVGVNSFLARRLEAIPCFVHVTSDHTADITTTIKFFDLESQEIDADAVGQLHPCQPRRLEAMTDTAVHVARSLRAHLTLHDIHHVALKLHYGITAGGECCLRFLSPADCDLGSADTDKLYTLLGGDQV